MAEFNLNVPAGAVDSTASRLKCKPEDLKAVFKAETGGKPGLPPINFTPMMAKGLGTTLPELKGMTPEEQLKYTEKYLAQAKKNAGISEGQNVDAATLYGLVLMPGRATKEVFCKDGEACYNGSTVQLDINKDGTIMHKELGGFLDKFKK